MKISYDLEVLPPRKGPPGGRSEETLALIAFLAGKQKNMKIDYEDPKECKRRYDTLRNYRRVNKLQEVFDLYTFYCHYQDEETRKEESRPRRYQHRERRGGVNRRIETPPL